MALEPRLLVELVRRHLGRITVGAWRRLLGRATELLLLLHRRLLLVRKGLRTSALYVVVSIGSANIFSSMLVSLCSIRRKATWKVSTRFCALGSTDVFCIQIFFIISSFFSPPQKKGVTYPKDRRVVRHVRWRLVLLGRIDNGQLFHVATTEDDVLVDLIGAGHFERWITLATFGAIA